MLECKLDARMTFPAPGRLGLGVLMVAQAHFRRPGRWCESVGTTETAGTDQSGNKLLADGIDFKNFSFNLYQTHFLCGKLKPLRKPEVTSVNISVIILPVFLYEYMFLQHQHQIYAQRGTLHYPHGMSICKHDQLFLYVTLCECFSTALHIVSHV